MIKTSKGILGNLTDDEGRCLHYHTKLDIIANKCSICCKFYACYKCHDEFENHPFGRHAVTDEETVMCGKCGYKFSYAEYEKTDRCPACLSEFNPGCRDHKGCYVNF